MGNSAPETFITLVATHTTDLVPISEGSIVEIPGGPAHYVGRALKCLEWPYRLITGDPVIVHVQRTAAGEQYIIPEIPRIQLPGRIEGAAVILSPIMQEIDAATLPPMEGMTIVDLQGFVRRPMLPTERERGRFDLRELLRVANVVKASERELRRLDSASLAALAECTLVITRGERGALVRRRGKEALIPARVVATDQTIGAGDSFLAAFTTALLTHGDEVRAAHFAARFTERFLIERLQGKISIQL
jgi:hypothetical protein